MSVNQHAMKWYVECLQQSLTTLSSDLMWGTMITFSHFGEDRVSLEVNARVQVEL